MFLPEVKNIFSSRTQMLLLIHVFPSLATMKTMLTRFQCCSLNLFPSNGKQTMADGEVEVEEKGGKGRNWKGDERCSLLCMRDIAHEDCVNKAKI